jgi:hypothetical protein
MLCLDPLGKAESKLKEDIDSTSLELVLLQEVNL